MGLTKFGSGYFVIDGEKYPVVVTDIYHTFGESTSFRGFFRELDFENDFLSKTFNLPGSTIKNVIFNNPATVVMWSDGSKTVVKCQPGDVYSKETGLALCIAKKFLGNKGNFNEVFKQWIPEESEDEDTSEIKVGDKVKIVRYGQTYSSYYDWVKRNVKKKKDVAKWASGALAKDGEIGVVKYLAPHERAWEGNIAYVEINGKCYMVHVDGLVKV